MVLVNGISHLHQCRLFFCQTNLKRVPMNLPCIHCVIRGLHSGCILSRSPAEDSVGFVLGGVAFHFHTKPQNKKCYLGISGAAWPVRESFSKMNMLLKVPGRLNLWLTFALFGQRTNPTSNSKPTPNLPYTNPRPTLKQVSTEHNDRLGLGPSTVSKPQGQNSVSFRGLGVV